MNLFEENNWDIKLNPLIDQYKDRKHPLEYNNLFQLMIMVILSAQDSDTNINRIAPKLFSIYPNLESIMNSSLGDFIPYIITVTNFNNKAKWIIDIANTLKEDKNIPLTLNSLILLKGIGRKSANVITREINGKIEGIIVDLHVIRVAPRIGLTSQSDDGNKIEKELIKVLPKKYLERYWNGIIIFGKRNLPAN